MKLNVLTNARPTSNLGTTLIVGCTSGQIKMTPDFGKLLGVVAGDRIGVGKDADGLIWAFKGGEDAQANGNKLAKSGNYLSMSSQNTWDILDGDENFNTEYNVEGEVVEDEDGTYVQIVMGEREAKVERKASDDTKEVTEDQGPETNTQGRDATTQDEYQEEE